MLGRDSERSDQTVGRRRLLPRPIRPVRLLPGPVRPPRLSDLPGAIGRLLDSITRPIPATGPVSRNGNPDAVVDCAVYANGLRHGGPSPAPYPEAARQARRRRGAFLWLGLHEPDLATMRPVAEVFGLHELLVDQAVSGGHRPGVQTLGEVTRLVLRTATGQKPVAVEGWRARLYSTRSTSSGRRTAAK